MSSFDSSPPVISGAKATLSFLFFQRNTRRRVSVCFKKMEEKREMQKRNQTNNGEAWLKN
jgi:hypothetical protein